MSNEQIKAFFQNFDDPLHVQQGGGRLAELRALMRENNISVWLVPHADEYQNEYPPKYAERLAWLTGFTGSAGYCIVTLDEAVVFVDGRYTLQVKDQVDPDHFTTDDLVNNSPDKWLSEWIKSEDQTDRKRIGFDSALITMAGIKKFKASTKEYSAELVPCTNFIDKIWLDQPHPPLEPVSLQAEEFSGDLAIHKLADIKDYIKSQGADYCLITDPASICWLFNIRGSDTPHTPLALGYCVVGADGYPMLFMDKRKLPLEEEAYLSQLTDLHPPSSLKHQLEKIAKDKTFLVDPNKSSFEITQILIENDGSILQKPDPVILKRAVKNSSEVSGSRAAHLRDGVAVTKFLCWLDQQQAGTIDEISVVEKLETLRRNTAKSFQSELLDISFDTISGAGANGAIVHYRVTNATNSKLENNSLYLVDSGGQYRDGTTDITRTIVIGNAPEHATEDFTLVLKGHIAIANACFPTGTRGVDLDPLARIALWQQGRDYAHGTGHGIGSYLSVHEGPQSISKRGMAVLEPGMIISNEPGFYRDGEYGIRIENLVLVNEPQIIPGGNVEVMDFETLSMAPIDLRLIDPSLLNEVELRWLNSYHDWVKRKLAPHMNNDENTWLEAATTPLSNDN